MVLAASYDARKRENYNVKNVQNDNGSIIRKKKKKKKVINNQFECKDIIIYNALNLYKQQIE